MEIQTIKKMEKKAIEESGVDFMKLGVAIFFMAMVLSYSFMTTGGVPNNSDFSIIFTFFTLSGWNSKKWSKIIL